MGTFKARIMLHMWSCGTEDQHMRPAVQMHSVAGSSCVHNADLSLGPGSFQDPRTLSGADQTR